MKRWSLVELDKMTPEEIKDMFMQLSLELSH